MSNYYGYAPPFSSHSSHSSQHGHHGRSRRGPRISSQNTHRQQYNKAQRSPKEMMPEQPQLHSDYLQRLEAARSFEFDDDEAFCPFHLLSEDDLQSIHSSSASDRSSLSSGSPEQSPLQPTAQPTPSLLLSTAPSFTSTSQAYQQHAVQQQQQQQFQLHQPLAQKTRNAIPIIDPSTRSVASPPLSVSPARQMQQVQYGRRW